MASRQPADLSSDYKNKLWGYNSGRSAATSWSSHPAGSCSTHEIQWASEHGRYEFDFIHGDEEYKYRFGGVNKYVMHAVVSAPQR